MSKSITAAEFFGNLQSPPTDDDFDTCNNDLDAGICTVGGVVKWFDAKLGYGFVVPDNGGADVLLHANAVSRSGFTAAPTGAKVTCKAVKTGKGWQAFEVLDIDASAIAQPVARVPRDAHTIADVGEWVRVITQWYNPEAGYGFVRERADGPDVFLHAETIRAGGLVTPLPGSIFEARIGRASKGLAAAAVRATTFKH